MRPERHPSCRNEFDLADEMASLKGVEFSSSFILTVVIVTHVPFVHLITVTNKTDEGNLNTCIVTRFLVMKME